ncbi:MAG: glycosyltransferase [Cyanobacteria bacterium K_Offshore_0m_m2_072]|nr:glycosyltransferase [Cyanobacteria bacterium K_Offshore_0m_m2_072]
MPSSIVASIVITCYNLEKYIASAIYSALSQDCGEAFEIIVVDDASSDRSLEIISEFDAVKLIRMPFNSGVLLATIAGIRSCIGDYIFFLDGDDLWSPSKLRLTLEAFKASDHIGLVTHDLNFVDVLGRQIQRNSRPAQVLSVALNSGELVKKGILNHSDYVWLGSAYAVRRSKVDLEGFCRWAESLPNPSQTYQDWPLAYWCVSIDSVECAFANQTLMSYRLHGANYSGDASTVDKAVSNVRKGYLTSAAICQICVIRSLRGYPLWFSRAKKHYYSYMLDLYCGRKSKAVIKFALLQFYLIATSNLFLKEWVRFFAIFFLGPDKFIVMLKFVFSPGHSVTHSRWSC